MCWVLACISRLGLDNLYELVRSFNRVSWVCVWGSGCSFSGVEGLRFLWLRVWSWGLGFEGFRGWVLGLLLSRS